MKERKEYKESEYSKKLRDPRCQKMRLEVLSRDGFTCQNCGNSKDTLHVHHCYYERGNDPWDYPSESLITLCLDCHENESANYRNALTGDEQPIIRDLMVIGFTQSDLEYLSVCVWQYETDTGKKHERRVLIDALQRVFRGEAA